MNKVKKLTNPPYFISCSAVGGYEEKQGPLGNSFDFCDESDTFGQKTWEMAEGEMGRCALNIALGKGNIPHDRLDMIIAGDLQNQCVASSVGLSSFGASFLGVYGACSTCTEALLIMSSMIDCGAVELGACVTTSHNSAAERQFRTPIEYGAQRTPTAQWTATAAGAFVLSPFHYGSSDQDRRPVKITEFMAGRIIDGATQDGSNMGAAMAFAAAESLIDYFTATGRRPRDFDCIVTGDLGKTGSDILHAILDDRLPTASSRHLDCGMMLYDKNKKDIHSGASGCGTSASVLASYFIPKLESGVIKNILFLSTGALMSPSYLLQGNNIKGIAPVIHIEAE